MSSDPVFGDPSTGEADAQLRASNQIPLVHRVYRILGARFRLKRVRDFLNDFNVTPGTRILDVGGTQTFWKGVPVNVTTVNLDPSNADRVADARCLPFADGSFDIVFSNSLIEHVGTFEDQEACAREIRRVGIRYYAQTPNRHFPVEPHYIAPFIHWFPVAWRRYLARLTPWAILTHPSPEQIEDFINSIRLLSIVEMRRLFPDAQLRCERFCGLAKSIIAERR